MKLPLFEKTQSRDILICQQISPLPNSCTQAYAGAMLLGD